MTEQRPEPTVELPNRQTPFSEPFREFIPQGWAPYPDALPNPLPAAVWTPQRRDAIAAAFPGERLVIPAGELKPRANDTDYRFRPHSAFAHLSGLGADREPGSVLVLEPTDAGPAATLYFKPRAPRTDPEFYADARYGEMWVGTRESLGEMVALTGLSCAPISELDTALAKNLDSLAVRIVRTADAIEAVVADLPGPSGGGRGERWVEGIFGLHARHQGNAIGYDTIAAGGDHANTLHWIRNDGELRPGDLLLLDAGVEVESLYTADITRTLPVSGVFSPAQRRVYTAVLEAQQAGMDAARPGAKFSDVHAAAVAVIARHLEEWGLLPVTSAASLDPVTGGHHRRWMVHGTSHHLGLDVHDCAQARADHYRDGVLQAGMVITVEPGLYFKSTDLLVPEELRGIGVRIEDDIAITPTGAEVLSDHLPRDPDAVEAWIAGIWSRP
ncbi:MAG: aminopeptidase P family protein [Propionibacteriaceae bacterium]|nr:aminopeptidase P family protein [Propionibacteriaceae bacterium]